MLHRAAAAVLIATSAHAADLCPGQPPLGVPVVAVTDGAVVCHTAWIALVDNAAKVPRWVAYQLTPKHLANSCLPRSDDFHIESQLPKESAKPSDYEGTGYDKGHQDPAEENSWDVTVERDSFSMANMAPQVPGLNRQGWARLEETVRSWTAERGPLTVFTGPVLAGSKTIGSGVAVPSAFWKVIVDKAGSVIAFQMPNAPVEQGPLDPYQVPLAEIEQQTGVRFPIKTVEQGTMWPVDLATYQKQHEADCKPKKE